MEKREVSTAISDLVLCLSSIRCAYYGHYSWGFAPTAVAGFVTVSLAAGMGFFRFGRFVGNLQRSIITLHDLATFLSTVSGLALIADAYVTNEKFGLLKYILNGISAMGFIGCLLFSSSLRAKIKEIASPVSLGIIVAMCIFSCGRGVINYYGIVGCACIIFAGLVVGASGFVLGTLKAVDVFHYVVAVGMVMLAGGLRWKAYNC